jgi:hypothetical protein
VVWSLHVFQLNDDDNDDNKATTPKKNCYCSRSSATKSTTMNMACFLSNIKSCGCVSISNSSIFWDITSCSLLKVNCKVLYPTGQKYSWRPLWEPQILRFYFAYGWQNAWVSLTRNVNRVFIVNNTNPGLSLPYSCLPCKLERNNSF